MIPIIDLHCDTISEIRKKERTGEDILLLQNNLSMDLEKMKRGGYTLQTFAVYVDYAQEPDCFTAAREILEVYKGELEANKDLISPITSYEQLEANEKNQKLSALLSLEEGAIYQDSLDNLHWFYQQGARMATLTWNYENTLGYPNHVGNPLKQKVWSWGEEKGLKEKGLLFLEEMERLHMLVDVSHLSDGGFWDVARHARRPFLASHSNSRSLAKGAARNLTDEMIRVIAEKGGITGLNYAVAFLRPDWTPDGSGAKLDEMVHMARHMVNVGGMECLGLGSDFDGIAELPEIRDCSQMQRLAEKLQEGGFTLTETEKIMSGNARRFLKENL